MEIKQGSTIIAQSTPTGRSAVGMVRLSGRDAVRLLGDCFKSKTAPQHALMRLGVFSAGGISDKVMACVFYAPNSYTGEDVVELYSHGSQAIIDRIIKHFLASGARYADGGEFTKRAFLNDKISLDEAEAVCDLINAESESQINLAFDAARGNSHKSVADAIALITDVLASIEAAIDYPEEDLELETADEARTLLVRAEKLLTALAHTYSDGSRIRGGIKVAIIGSPNAGKSSLLNALLGYNRAIVTPRAGTTRDTIEENFTYKGLLFNLIDTAGLRDAVDQAEIEGVQRSSDAAKLADIVLWLGDTVDGFCEQPSAKAVIKVLNKTDLVSGEEFCGGHPTQKNPSVGVVDVCVSALHGDGVDELKELLYERSKVRVGGGDILTNRRHYEAVLGCLEQLRLAIADLSAPPDCYSVYLKNALTRLGEISGATASEEVIDRIFSKFCVGK